MLYNYNTEDICTHVKFVSYTGKYPNLCTGILTLQIDGKEVKFGGAVPFKTGNHERFWESGGCCGRGDLYTGEWQIDFDRIPDEYKKYAIEFNIALNDNVEYGCCGGCR